MMYAFLCYCIFMYAAIGLFITYDAIVYDHSVSITYQREMAIIFALAPIIGPICVASFLFDCYWNFTATIRNQLRDSIIKK